MKILFFGMLRDALGDELEVAPAGDETVAQLRTRLARLYPDVARDLLSPRIRVCVADAIVGEDFRLGGHDHVEFLPPVSGG